MYVILKKKVYKPRGWIPLKLSFFSVLSKIILSTFPECPTCTCRLIDRLPNTWDSSGTHRIWLHSSRLNICIISYWSNGVFNNQLAIKLTNIFYLLFCNFDSFLINILQLFFSFTLSYVPNYLHIFTMTWAGRKNVGTFIN